MNRKSKSSHKGPLRRHQTSQLYGTYYDHLNLLHGRVSEQQLLHLGGGECDRLQGPDDVGEPEPHKLHAPLFNGAENEVTLLVHAGPFLARH